MPEHAEFRAARPRFADAQPREFPLSEFESSRCRLLSVIVPSVCVASLFALLATAGSPHLFLALGLSIVAGASSVVAARLWWVKASRPFARLSGRGLSLEDGMLFRTIPWNEIYAIEARDGFTARLKLSRMRSMTLDLTVLEREERPAFVESVRQWIFSSH